MVIGVLQVFICPLLSHLILALSGLPTTHSIPSINEQPRPSHRRRLRLLTGRGRHQWHPHARRRLSGSRPRCRLHSPDGLWLMTIIPIHNNVQASTNSAPRNIHPLLLLLIPPLLFHLLLPLLPLLLLQIPLFSAHLPSPHPNDPLAQPPLPSCLISPSTAPEPLALLSNNNPHPIIPMIITTHTPPTLLTQGM